MLKYAQMKQVISLPDWLKNLFKEFSKNGYEVYAVGGAVRDSILGKNVKDWDLTTDATPEQIQHLFTHTFYNNSYGTVTIQVEVKNDTDNKPITQEQEFVTHFVEVTPFRLEGDYRDGRHPSELVWGKSLEADLIRRDFTVNALCVGENGEVIDMVGGLEDLKNRQIRAVGDAKKRFIEDGLRLMRAVRFCAQLGFLLEKETREALTAEAGLISQISSERIRDELFKILTSPYPADGILMLKSVGLLKLILPEVEACFGVDQKSEGRHHIYDVGTHLIQSLKSCASKDPITLLACLLHDIGKVTTRRITENGVVTFYNHEHVGAQMAKKIADRLRLSNIQKDRLVRFVRFHMFTVSEDQTDKALRRFIKNVGVENLDEMLMLRVGDRVGSGARVTSWRTELFKKRLQEVQIIPFLVKDLAIDGSDVMKELDLKPGPQIGKILQEIFLKVEEKEIKNDREELLAELKKVKM